jgi:hypothetical protein
MKLKIDPRKSFILKVTVGTGILLLLWGYSADMREGAAKTALSNQQLAQEIEENKGRFLGAESVSMKKNRILCDEFLPALKEQLEFPDTLEPAPKEIDPAVHLKQVLSESQRELRNDAARKSLVIPEREWDIANRIKKENTPEEISELRLRLSATRKILSTCIEGGVLKVVSVSQNLSALEEIENTPYAIARFPITIQIDSDLRGIANLLLSFQKKGNFLEVRSFSVKSKSERDSVLSAQIEFAAIRFDEKSKLSKEIETKLQPGPGQRPPVRVPRRRL